MKKVDEMYGNIKLRSESVGFRTALLALATWVLYLYDTAASPEADPVTQRKNTLSSPVIIMIQKTDLFFLSDLRYIRTPEDKKEGCIT